ncbi:nucleotide disphospho-sugar-binding domain-containing protein [Amycolatopsis sp. NPDC059021]|uniref:nucleotide disphospho-sugar-binding domain-containing protein n=1 Tax=Amycolatopsis sp. NPDC059021 TaxID=3346704 RepID=UPI00366B488A
MRVLVLPPPAAATHLMAMVPLSWALRAMGHDVLVAGTPDLAATAASAGLGFAEVGSSAEFDRAFDEIPTEDMFPAPEWMLPEFADQKRLQIHNQADMQAAYTRGFLGDYRELADRWRPDLLLADLTLLLARVLGGVTGIPVVAHRWGVDPTGAVFEDRAREQLAPLCGSRGLPGFPVPSLLVDPCPPSLQWEGAPPGQPMRYLPSNGVGVYPLWTRELRAGRRVCVCPGRTVLRVVGPRAMRAVAAALEDLVDVEVVFALTAEDRARVGSLPPRFRVVESLPLAMFLDTCDAFVSLGGGGSALTAAALGVPQLVLPQWFDHFDLGRRLGEAGAGISIDSKQGQADIPGITKAVSALLEDRSFAGAAAVLKAENAASPTPAQVAELVTDVVSG